MFVGDAYRGFFRTGLGCWAPLPFRQAVACGQCLGSGIMYFVQSNNVGSALVCSVFLFLLSSGAFFILGTTLSCSELGLYWG